jgi:hypothetical protein
MKKLIFTASTILLINLFNAQNTPVERNVTGVQIGLFGVDVYNETKLDDKWALRSEVSIFSAVWGGDIYDKTGFALYPAITLQPKYYYNIGKRAEAGKNTKHNSANYIGLQVRYNPDWFVISNAKNITVNNKLSFIPTFGIRRNFSEHFNYEFKAGLGYGTTLGVTPNTSGGVLDLSLKVGYDF